MMWTHLDTHVVVYLANGELNKLPKAAFQRIESSRPMVTPMVLLELNYLNEIGRIIKDGATIREYLRDKIDLGVAESSFERTALIASTLSWTRDPFDRLIAAHAMADDVPLITRDSILLQHCPVAMWDA
jgi:PIN domain nuclease of toxin-antitoxin system